MMHFIKSIHLAVAFLLELAMLFCLGYYGFHSGDSALQSWAIGIGLPVAVILVWGLFAAPRAQRRLPVVYLIPFKL
ncbi:MAG: YrdB family protein, partial [Flavipsychrobacter sp.]